MFSSQRREFQVEIFGLLMVDLAQHYFLRANITAIRRVRKTDNMRIARAVGASIVNRPEDLKESDVGVGCGLFHLEKIADEYFLYLEVRNMAYHVFMCVSRLLVTFYSPLLPICVAF